MPRYRVMVDVVDENGSLDTTAINSILEELQTKASLAVTGEQKRHGISTEMIANPYSGVNWHHHVGNSCRGCERQAEDGIS